MSEHITAWVLNSIDADEAPRSLAELSARFSANTISVRRLVGQSKWEPILRGDDTELPPGWVELGSLASTRRGIATGANEFFLLSDQLVEHHNLSRQHLVPAIGRANDVPSLVFNQRDFDDARLAGARCWLLDIKGELSKSDAAYVAHGEANGFHKRYLTAHRSPWFSMEQREVAPIWASVFGRGDLEFVYNDAGVKSLTNFHCVYPSDDRPIFIRALTVILNSEMIRARSKLHTRGFGGGLAKFEPNDLKSIPVPDIRNASYSALEALAQELPNLDQARRTNDRIDEAERRIALGIERVLEIIHDKKTLL